MENSEVLNNLIYSIYVGSYAYGTNMPGSDMDEGGICIPDKETVLGFGKFEQANEWEDENGEPVDKTIYSINKAIPLMINNNPNMLDYLFIPDRCIIKLEKEWEQILSIRDEFLSSKCKFTYQGYSFSQLERIQTHRAYLLSPVTRPNREDFGLTEKSLFPETQYEVISKLSTDFIPKENREVFNREMITLIENEFPLVFRKYMSDDMIQILLPEIKKSMGRYLHTISSISDIYLKDEYAGMAAKELAYLSAYKNWRRYEKWKNSRNENRKKLEEKCGYDSKHAMHLIRLAKMSVEILSGKGVLVDRTNIDADELKDIRVGNWKFEDILSYSDKLNNEADELYDSTTLPRRANYKLIERTTMNIVEKYLFG